MQPLHFWNNNYDGTANPIQSDREAVLTVYYSLEQELQAERNSKEVIVNG